MNYSLITVRYAKALFSLAKEKNILNKVKSDVDLINELINQHPELLKYISYPFIKPSMKVNVLSRLFKKNVDEITFALLEMIVKNKREVHLKDILRNYYTLYREDQNIKTTTITTAVPLDDEHRQNVVDSIESAFDINVELNEAVNSDIIGGLIIQIEDSQLDLSVAKKLQRIESELLNIDLKSKI